MQKTLCFTGPRPKKLYGYNREEFIITGITYPIGVGTMSITGSNIKELPET